jgi:O-antigen/teichoic acid export membrane protein
VSDRIARSVYWIVWSRGVVQALSFGATLIIVRLLEPSDFGLMALVNIWTATLLLITELGLGGALVQFPNLDQRDLNGCFYLMLGMACTAYALLFIGAPFIATWFDTPQVVAVLRVAGLLLPLEAASIVPDALLRKRLAFDKVTRAEIVAAVVSVAITLGLAWLGAGVWALVAGVLVRSAIRGGTTFWLVRWFPGRTLGSARFRAIMTFSFGTFSSRVLWTLYSQSDMFVLGKVSGEVVLGLYGMARDLANLPITRISSVVNQLAAPVLAEQQADKAAMRHSLLRALRLVAGVSLPLSLGLAVLAEDVVRVALTDRWIATVPILQILCVVSAFRSLEVLLPPMLRARYRTTFLAGYNLTLVVVMPVAFLIGALWRGPRGVAIAWLTIYPVLNLWITREATRELDLRWSILWVQIRGPVAASVAMSAVLLAVRGLLWSPDLATSWIRVLAGTAVGAMTYGVVLWFASPHTLLELAEVTRWVFRFGGPRVQRYAPAPERAT